MFVAPPKARLDVMAPEWMTGARKDSSLSDILSWTWTTTKVRDGDEVPEGHLADGEMQAH